MTGEAWNIVKSRLEKRWFLEEVAKWLEKEYPEYAMSGKTIYNYVLFSHERGTEEAGAEGFASEGEGAKKGKSGGKTGEIPEMTLTGSRPAEINAREAPGHWESVKNPFQHAVFSPPVDSDVDGMPGAENRRERPPFTAVFADVEERVKEVAAIDFRISPLFRKKVNNFFFAGPGLIS
jgi:hypothetical protein